MLPLDSELKWFTYVQYINYILDVPMFLYVEAILKHLYENPVNLMDKKKSD